MSGGRFGEHGIASHICVPTLMHSGTHLLRYVILKGYIKNKNEDCLYNGDSGRDMLTFHVHSHTDQYKQELITRPVFTSLRHPYRMIQSYRRRENQGGVGLSQKIHHFHTGWKFMLEEMPKYDPMFVHVDSDIRDEQVDAMADFLKLDLGHDWRVNELSGSVCGTHTLEIGDDPEVKQEYIDFYYDSMKNDRG